MKDAGCGIVGKCLIAVFFQAALGNHKTDTCHKYNNASSDQAGKSGHLYMKFMKHKGSFRKQNLTLEGRNHWGIPLYHNTVFWKVSLKLCQKEITDLRGFLEKGLI